MIRTKEVNINSIEFFKLLLFLRLKSFWYSFLIAPAAALIVYITNWDTEGGVIEFLLVFSVIYILYPIVYYYVYASSEKNLAALQSRVYEVKDNFLNILVGGEMVGEIQLDKTRKVVESQTFLVIYQLNGQFLFIPKTAFASENELAEFKQLLSKMCKSYKPK